MQYVELGLLAKNTVVRRYCKRHQSYMTYQRTGSYQRAEGNALLR